MQIYSMKDLSCHTSLFSCIIVIVELGKDVKVTLKVIIDRFERQYDVITIEIDEEATDHRKKRIEGFFTERKRTFMSSGFGVFFSHQRP